MSVTHSGKLVFKRSLVCVPVRGVGLDIGERGLGVHDDDVLVDVNAHAGGLLDLRRHVDCSRADGMFQMLVAANGHSRGSRVSPCFPHRWRRQCP